MPMTQTPKIGDGMKAYESPTIVTLGAVSEMTQAKCGGSGDIKFPTILEQKFGKPSECSS
jgi:hypothetical protein